MRADSWRKLPTAWIHFAVVECVGIWAAIASWFVLIPTVEITTIGANPQSTSIQHYFQQLFFLGFVSETTLNYTGIAQNQNWFVDNVTETPIEWSATGTGDDLICTLVLPATHVGLTSVNMPWLIVAWILPLCSVCFVVYLFSSLIRSGIWSFEEIAYIEFTFDTYSSFKYRVGSLSMALGPLALAVLWGAQIVIYAGENQGQAFVKSIPSLFVLILAVKTICLPWVRGHHWNTNRAPDEFLQIRLRRPIKHVNPTDTSGHNSVFSLNLAHALWLAKFGDFSALTEFVFVEDYNDAAAVEAECRRVLDICERKVKQEREESQALATGS